MDMCLHSAATKNIIKNNIKILSLSTIVLLFNAQYIAAQTINTPVTVNPGDSFSHSNASIVINAVGKEAIKVSGGSLQIQNSDVSLESDTNTILVNKKGSLTLTGTAGKAATILSTSASGRAIYANGETTVKIDGFNIIATGTENSGMGTTGVIVRGTYNKVDANFDLLNSQISTVHVRGLSIADSHFNASSFKITTGRDEATGVISEKKNLYGINAENQNIITLTNGSVETYTANSTGINFVMDIGDTSVERAKVTNVAVITHGSNATGIDNINTRSSINGGSILTYGTGAHGIGASNGGVDSWAPSHAAVTGTKITTNGRQAYGLVATTKSDIQAKAVNITTTGASGVGVYSQGTGRINVSDNSTITTSGEGAHAVAAMLGTEINLTDTIIHTTGANAAGIYMTGNYYKDPDTPQGRTVNPSPTPQAADDDDDYPWRTGVDSTGKDVEDITKDNNEDRVLASHSNIVTLTRSTLNIADGAALRIFGGENNKITISGSTIKADQGANALLLSSDIYNSKHEVGTAEVNVTASRLSGDILVNSGEINLALSDNSLWSGAAQTGTDDRVLNSLTLDKSSKWLITGNSTINSLSNTGAIAFFPTNSDFKTLTVQSNYESNGGLFAINSKLGADNSETDKIIFQGDVSGNNLLAVRNAGGLGAQTVEGIKVIEVEGASDGAFTLVGAYRNRGANAVVAGAYTYKLYQGSTSAPDDGNWYLRSELEEDGYQAGVPVYEVYPQLLLGLNSLPTMQQRVGNRHWNNSSNQTISQGADAIEPYTPAAEAGSFTQSNGVWGRMEGSHNKISPHTSTSDATYDYNVFKMQAGLDGMLHETEQGKMIGGIVVHYAHGKADIWSRNDSDLGSGRIKTDGYGFGGTLTWYSDDGFYIDNQAQVTWYRSDLSYQGGQSSLADEKNNGFGYGFSSEIGKRFALDEHWSLTPQAQLNYSNVNFDSFTDVFGADVSREHAASLQARLGISADYQNSWRNEQGVLNRSSVYGIANLYNEFLNGTRVDVASVQFTNKNESLWAGIGLGGSYNWNDDRYSVYGEGSINTSLKNFGDSYAYKGILGFRVKW